MYRILDLNPQLHPFAGDIDLRMFLYRATKSRILTEGQTLNDFASAHHYYGIHHVPGGWVYREWAPAAYQLYLEGEFNNWNQTSHPLKNLGNGDWELFLEGDDALWDGCKVKTVVDAVVLMGIGKILQGLALGEDAVLGGPVQEHTQVDVPGKGLQLGV